MADEVKNAELAPEVQDEALDESCELSADELEKIAGGIACDDPRNRNHDDKKDDPLD